MVSGRLRLGNGQGQDGVNGVWRVGRDGPDGVVVGLPDGGGVFRSVGRLVGSATIVVAEISRVWESLAPAPSRKVAWISAQSDVHHEVVGI
jgi:hypothetical protein